MAPQAVPLNASAPTEVSRDRIWSQEHQDLHLEKGSTDESASRWNSRCLCLCKRSGKCRGSAEPYRLRGSAWSCKPTC
jgi:hypothetical protein